VRETAATIAATEFRARCLALLDQVAQNRLPLVVTKHARPVAMLVPYAEDVPPVFGILAGTVHASDDLVAPTGERWDVEDDALHRHAHLKVLDASR
jgi:prevent-host-death family protein